VTLIINLTKTAITAHATKGINYNHFKTNALKSVEMELFYSCNAMMETPLIMMDALRIARYKSDISA